MWRGRWGACDPQGRHDRIMSNEDVWKAWQAAAFESLIQALCSSSLALGVVNLERQRDDIRGEPENCCIHISCRIQQADGDGWLSGNCLSKASTKDASYSLACSNCESCVFTGGKGFPVWLNVFFFCSFYCLLMLFLFCFSVWLSSAIYACPRQWRVSKGVCVTVAEMLLLSVQRLDLFPFSVLLKWRKNLEWRIGVYFRLLTVAFPVTPFVRYVKVVGCELSREHVSLFPTTSKATDRVTWQNDKRQNSSI